VTVEIQPLAGPPPPVILKQSGLHDKLKPTVASVATQSNTKQVQKQTAQRQLKNQLRRRLPMTQVAYEKRK
jgi:hypothetical protein